MRCPNCGQVNPVSVTRCDCGRDLQTRAGAIMEENFYSQHEGKIGCVTIFVLCFFLMWIGGCFVSGRDPVSTMQRELNRFQEYSVIVMDLEDGFFRNSIKLKGVFKKLDAMLEAPQQLQAGKNPDPKMANAKPVLEQVEREYTVKESVINKYTPYIGMVVAAKTRDGKMRGLSEASPPYYQYVGQRRYGYWGGGGYWNWYPSYGGFTTGLLVGHMISRNDYRSYTTHRDSGRSYYGRDSRGRQAFGVKGTTTAKSRPNFVRKYKAKQSRSTSPVSRSRFGSTRRSGGWFSGGK